MYSMTGSSRLGGNNGGRSLGSIVIHPMPLLPADVQVPLWTPTNIHLRSKAAATASAPSTSHFRRRMGLEAVALPNLSQLFFVFCGQNCSGVMYIPCSAVPKKKEGFGSCRVCRLLSGLAR